MYVFKCTLGIGSASTTLQKYNRHEKKLDYLVKLPNLCLKLSETRRNEICFQDNSYFKFLLKLEIISPTILQKYNKMFLPQLDRGHAAKTSFRQGKTHLGSYKNSNLYKKIKYTVYSEHCLKTLFIFWSKVKHSLYINHKQNN